MTWNWDKRGGYNTTTTTTTVASSSKSNREREFGSVEKEFKATWPGNVEASK